MERSGTGGRHRGTAPRRDGQNQEPWQGPRALRGSGGASEYQGCCRGPEEPQGNVSEMRVSLGRGGPEPCQSPEEGLHEPCGTPGMLEALEEVWGPRSAAKES